MVKKKNTHILKTVFIDVDKYIGYKSEIVQPVIFQDTIVFPPRALENALQCKGYPFFQS